MTMLRKPAHKYRKGKISLSSQQGGASRQTVGTFPTVAYSAVLTGTVVTCRTAAQVAIASYKSSSRIYCLQMYEAEKWLKNGASCRKKCKRRQQDQVMCIASSIDCVIATVMGTRKFQILFVRVML